MSDWQVGQLGRVPDVQIGMVGDVANHQRSDHFSGSTQKTGYVESTFGNPLLNPIRTQNDGMWHSDFPGTVTGSSNNWMSTQPGNQGAAMLNNMSGGNLSLPVKRKAEPIVTPRKHGPSSNPASTGLPVQSSVTKKMARSDSTLGKSGQPVKKQTTKIGSSQDASEAVRSKMRESLSSALELAMPKSVSVSNSENNNSDSSSIQKLPLDSQTSEPSLNTGSGVPGSGSGDTYQSQELVATVTSNKSQMLPSVIPSTESRGNGEHSSQEFHYLPDVEDVSFSDNFFVKDDLLQGNGLSWASFNFDMQMSEGMDAQISEKLQAQSGKEEADGQANKCQVATSTPEDLAFKIEAELFKLHGGVNKKYREKGRSLLFNLKDHNNPELRERVMSGEIPPDRLCSMSAEELASKELSEWRIAKAEEMAQMVVLPDTEVDMRRLVKKTHKGEYQVEFERDESAVADVSAGTSVFTQPLQQKQAETNSPAKVSDEVKDSNEIQESSTENKDISGSLIIPTDGTDLMQGMMVDEIKDAELLPPIISLDEFMKSLDSEPPFENLSEDARQRTPTPNEEKSKVNLQASDRASDSPKKFSSKNSDAVKKHAAGMATKLSKSPVKQKVLPSASPKVDYIWEGKLQLNISSSVTVGCLFQSGEKTSTKEWPTSLEIKGRVRRDAFEKFLQELHKSRTRAVMVLQFILKNKSSELERSNLSQAIDSYSSDDRVGYAEPASGAELYLCPPTPSIFETLNKNIMNERFDTERLTQNGLIGVVVWRRAHVSGGMISPTNISSSHHKQAAFKRQQKQPYNPSAATRVVKDLPNVNIKTLPPVNVSSRPNPSKLEEDDDVPPGFGPGAPKDDDDLPEFNFSSDSLSTSLSRDPSQNFHPGGVRPKQRSVDHVRELIQKYGKSGGDNSTLDSRPFVNNRSLGGGIKPWNDDDDDIPEWLPHQVHHQNMAPVVAQQSPSGVVPPRPGGGGWARPPSGTHYGAGWRQQ